MFYDHSSFLSISLLDSVKKHCSNLVQYTSINMHPAYVLLGLMSLVVAAPVAQADAAVEVARDEPYVQRPCVWGKRDGTNVEPCEPPKA